MHTLGDHFETVACDFSCLMRVDLMPIDTTRNCLFRTVTKMLKSALKSPKSLATNIEETPPILTKTQSSQPLLQGRPSLGVAGQQQMVPPSSASTIMSKSLINSDSSSPLAVNSEALTNEPVQAKSSMSTSSYATLMSMTANDQKETTNASETGSTSVPAVLARTGKAAIGPRVLPALDPTGDAPPVKLRHIPAEKKGNKTRRIQSSSIQFLFQ